MNGEPKQWTSQELYDLSQRRRDLYPEDLDFHEGYWWLARGPKHDLEVGTLQVLGIMLMEANAILELNGKDAFTDLSAAVAELDRKRPYRS